MVVVVMLAVLLIALRVVIQCRPHLIGPPLPNDETRIGIQMKSRKLLIKTTNKTGRGHTWAIYGPIFGGLYGPYTGRTWVYGPCMGHICVHIWAIYGPYMGPYMGDIWAHMGHILPIYGPIYAPYVKYIVHVRPIYGPYMAHI